MSDERDPERDQVAPVHNDNPSCHDLVIEDLKERKQFGLRKYNTELQPFNGRSFLLDVYEELMDAIVYVKGRLYEEEQREREERREWIDALLAQLKTQSLIILPSSAEIFKSDDTFPFTQTEVLF